MTETETKGPDYWDDYCSRCGDELADDRHDDLCQSCDDHLEHRRRERGVRCDRCDGHGRIYGTYCDIQRATNGRDTVCPECGGSGRTAFTEVADE